MRKLWNWFSLLIRGIPHFTIGDLSDPYMRRWYLIPRNRFFNLYLHQFLRDDDDRALHDHPWWFISIMLKGRYIEKMEGEHWWIHRPRKAGSIAFRKAEHRHQVILFKKTKPSDTWKDECIPCWTLVITGPTVRNWGFWCPKGFVPWQDFVQHDANGNKLGKGCGE